MDYDPTKNYDPIKSLGRRMCDAWQSANRPANPDCVVTWDDYDAEQQACWERAAVAFTASLSHPAGEKGWPPFDVIPLIAGALLHERQHWREAAAAQMDSLLRAIEHPELQGKMHGRPKVPMAALVQELREWAANLRTSLEGDYYPACEGCGQMVYPDDVQFPMTDVNMHARCFGEPDARHGDQVAVDREHVEVEEGEVYSGFVTLFARGNLYTDAQLEAIMAKADALLMARGGLV